MFGPKKLFLLGLVIFTASSAACGVAQDPNQLILFRVIQGVGGAILTPQSLSIITSIFPPDRRGAAFGVWGAVAGLAAVAGPTLGGFLTTTFSWRAIFYVNVPIGILTVTLAVLLMPELTIHRKHRLDLVGVLLVSAGLFGVIFALIEGERYDWGRISNLAAFDIGQLASGLVSISSILVGGIILVLLFVVWEARQEEPLLPLALFRDVNFSVANLVSAIVSFGMFGLFFPLTIFLQSVLGLDAEHAGVVFVPMSLTSMVVAPVAGRMADRLNGKYILAAGLTLFAAGLGIMIAVASLSSTGLTFTPALVVAGVGMGCTFAPMVTLAMRNVNPTQAGAASGFINTVRQVGGSVGSAVVGAVLQHRLATDLHSQAVQRAGQVPAAFRAQFIQGFVQAARGGFHVGTGALTTAVPKNLPPAVQHHLQALGQAVFRNAYLSAMKPSLALSVIALLIGAVVALLMRSGRGAQAQAAEQPREPGVAVAGG
jgi:EmrB/QacA subfamily drug resistance transporter